MRSWRKAWIVLGLGLMTAGCNPQSKGETSVKQATPTPAATSVEEIKARITEDSAARWKTELKSLGKKSLEVVHFSDVNHGWVASRDSLYKTADAGRTWTEVTIKLPPGALFSDVYFVSSTNGWVAVNKGSEDLLDSQSNQFWIMNTSNGGQTWTVQYTQQSAVLTRIVLVDDQEGWAVGMNTIAVRPITQVHYVLHTRDAGKTWRDVSNRLNRAATDEQNRVQDHITDIYAKPPAKLLLLSLRGRVFSTENDGGNWQRVATLSDEPQTCNCRLGVTENGNVWVLGGANSREGKWGWFAREESTNLWKRFRPNGVYFSDAVYLSNNRVIASGSMPSPEKPGQNRTTEEGMLLYSSDGGQDWSIVYRSTKMATIKKLAAVGSDRVWAVGEGGFILSLEFSPNNTISSTAR
jgi:photosystem II stability/assembly factor-like uncharacterized protein